MCGLDQLGANPQPDPPHRERREPPQGIRRERRAVIGADPLGEAVAPKQARKYGPACLDRRLEQAAAAEQEERRAILDRERVAIPHQQWGVLLPAHGPPTRVALRARRLRPASVVAARAALP